MTKQNDPWSKKNRTLFILAGRALSKHSSPTNETVVHPVPSKGITYQYRDIHYILPDLRAALGELVAVISDFATSIGDGSRTFQDRVMLWLFERVGVEAARERQICNAAFLRSTLEAARASGAAADEARRILEDVYREPASGMREVLGEVMVAIARLSLVNHLDMRDAGEAELLRLSTDTTRHGSEVDAQSAGQKSEGGAPPKLPFRLFELFVRRRPRR
jgi:hypothetical protein